MVSSIGAWLHSAVVEQQFRLPNSMVVVTFWINKYLLIIILLVYCSTEQCYNTN